MNPEPNCYSRRWFEFFHDNLDEIRTEREVRFIRECAPLPEFRDILDVCCGGGRHARALADVGYSVVGIDRDANVIAKARELGGGPTFVQNDIRECELTPGEYDAIIIMGQSFGYFDDATNRDMLRRFAIALRPSGRIILDLWNPEFFVAHQGERDLKTPAGVARETKHIEADHLFVELEYPDGSHDRFEWQLFSPSQMKTVASLFGLSILSVCTDFNQATPPNPANPRTQFVLELKKALSLGAEKGQAGRT